MQVPMTPAPNEAPGQPQIPQAYLLMAAAQLQKQRLAGDVIPAEFPGKNIPADPEERAKEITRRTLSRALGVKNVIPIKPGD